MESKSIEEAYTKWSAQYDTNTDRTRDLEAVALQRTLCTIEAESILEIGCGTGKNTVYLAGKASRVVAVDLTEAMLEKARQKVTVPGIQFIKANISEPWYFTNDLFRLITFSLILEHINKLDFIFTQASLKLAPGGYVYVGGLHPFKQYAGTKARFETETGVVEVACFTHHFSDFVQAAKRSGFQLVMVDEYFDDDDLSAIPRILSLLFRKP